MSLRTNALLQCFRKSKEEYIRKIRFYPSFLYSFLDRWLKRMSLSGWHIVHCGIVSFWFEKGPPLQKEYFTYGDPPKEGKYSISLRYPGLEKTYGVKKKASKINSNEAKAHRIIEIDERKIDVKNNSAYLEMVKDRNYLYLVYFLRNVGFILALAGVAIIAGILQ